MNPKSETTVIKMENIPLNEDGEPDIAAILAANGFADIDMSKVEIKKEEKP